MGSKYTHIFEPIKVRGVSYKNRIILAPPSTNLSSEDGLVTKDFVNWFQMFARGGVGTLYVGNCTLDFKECKDEAFQIDLGDDRIILPVTWYADMCKQYGCNASFQINHVGEYLPADGRTSPAGFDKQPNPPVESSRERLHEIIEKYADAARRMQRAGMNIAMVNGAHGNLSARFISPLYNKRTDEYGGSLENRCRFTIEICEAIRRKCGENFVIELRISADEIAEGGVHFDETLKIIGILKDYVDIFHVSAGLRMHENGKYMRHWLQNYMVPRELNVQYARRIKEAYPDVLVTTVGSIMSLDRAEEIIENGWADFVAMCRPLMADPEMPRKYAENRPEDRRPCLRCLRCCTHLFVPKPIQCAVNPMSFMVRELTDGLVPRARTKKKTAVIGGGPAGITALTTLIERGHDVTLYEKSDKLGGNVNAAAAPSFKIDCRDYLEWLVRQPGKVESQAKVLLNTEATREVLERENYDALIIAVGAEPVFPKVPGIDKPHVSWAADIEPVLSSDCGNVVIVGAGSVGLEAAIELRQAGKNVAIIELADEASLMMTGGASGEFARLIKELEIPAYFETALVEICDDKVIAKSSGKTLELPADTVLVATGMRPREEIVHALRRCAPEIDVHIVGDAREAGSICEAVNTAFQAALRV